jgi:hypothetical protein
VPSRNLTVFVRPGRSGTLTTDDMDKCLELVERLKNKREKAVVVLSDPEWATLSEHCTFADAFKCIEVANEPMYTQNTHTSLFSEVRFFMKEGDMMDNLVAFFSTEETSGFNASEDILIGTPDSYTSYHLDNAPCNPNIITVIIGKKKVVACPFHPDKVLPDDIPVSHVVQGRVSRHITYQDWIKMEDYALDNEGWVKELGPGENCYQLLRNINHLITLILHMYMLCR